MSRFYRDTRPVRSVRLMEHPARTLIRACSAPVSFETIKQLFLPRQVLPRHRSLVKTVRDPPSTTRVASSVLCLTNGHLVGRITDSRFYNNSLVCARRDSSCVPDSVRASLACSNNLCAATSSSSTEDVSVVVLARAFPQVQEIVTETYKQD